MIIHEPVGRHHTGIPGIYTRNPDQEIARFVTRVRRRQREVLIVNYGVAGLAAGFLAAFVMSGISLAVPFYYAVPAGMTGIVIALVASIIAAVVKTPGMEKSALMADEKGLRERVITAFSLRGRTDGFSMLQKRNAAAIISRFSVEKAFPLSVDKKTAALLILTVIGFLILSTVPSAAKERARAEHQIMEEAEAEIEKVEDVLRDIKTISEISLVEKEALTEMLGEVKKEMQEVRTGEELKKAEERFQKKLESAMEKTENEELARALEEKIDTELKKETQNYEGEFEKVKQALQEAENGGRDSLGDAARQMEELAELLGDMELAEAAGELRISEGTITDIQAAELLLAEALERADGNGQSGGEEADLFVGEQGGDQNGGQNGDGQDEGFEELYGLISGSQGGTGSGNNGFGGRGGDGWDTGSAIGQEGSAKSPQEMVTVPDAAIGDDENLTGKQNDSSQSYLQESDQSLTWAGEQVDYNQVKSEYSQRAYEKVDGANYPGEVKEQIKSYFEQINR